MLVLMFVNSIQIMGMKFIFSILCLEDFENYVTFGIWANLVNWGFLGQNGNLDIMILNYDIK